MTKLNEFIQASDRLVALDSRFVPDLQSSGSLTIFRNKVQELWEDIEGTYRALIQFINSDNSTISAAEKANIEEKYSTIFCTYAVLQGKIDTLITQCQADISQTSASLGRASLRIAPTPRLLPPPVVTLQVPSGSRPQIHDEKSQTSGLTTPVTHANPAEPSPFLSQLFASTGMHFPQNPNEHRLPLPPCDIATFKGDYSSWPTFRDLFTAVFVNNRRLSDVERLFHLLNKTSGDAKDIVSRAPLTREGFKIAWD